MVVFRVLKRPKGYLLIEGMITIFIASLFMLSMFTVTTSYLGALQNNLSAVVLFSQLHYGQISALSQDTDVTFQVENNALTQSEPQNKVCWSAFTNQTLQLTNHSGIGFTESGHTKYSGTLKLNDLASPAVSLGVGFGKISLK